MFLPSKKARAFFLVGLSLWLPATYAGIIQDPPALIDRGSYITDTANHLDWLKFNRTLGMTFDAAVTANVSDGWRAATLSEIDSLWRHFGWTADTPSPFGAGANQNAGLTDAMAKWLGYTFPGNWPNGCCGNKFIAAFRAESVPPPPSEPPPVGPPPPPFPGEPPPPPPPPAPPPPVVHWMTFQMIDVITNTLNDQVDRFFSGVIDDTQIATWLVRDSLLSPAPRPLAAPTVDLLINSEALKRTPYSARARISNNSSEDITVRLQLTESYPSSPPMLDGDPHVGLPRDFLLTAGETREVPLTLVPFFHWWNWIDPQPVSSMTDYLETGGERFIDFAGKYAEFTKLVLADNVAKVAGGLIAFVNGLKTISTPTIPTVQIFYTLTRQYGRPLDESLTALPAIRKEVTLHVDEHDLNQLGQFMTSNIAAASSTTLGIASLLSLNPAAIPFLLGEYVLIEQSKHAYLIALDPIDENFTEIATPTPLQIPEIDELPDGLPKTYALLLRELSGYKSAEFVSLNRMIAAREVGDDFWQSEQLDAASGYAMAAADAQTRIASTLELLKGMADKLDDKRQDVLTYLQSVGIPPIERQYLLQSGWTETDIQNLREALQVVAPIATADHAIKAMKVSVLLSADAAARDMTTASTIRAENLGVPSRDPTLEERATIEGLRVAIDMGLSLEIPSSALLESIRRFNASVLALVKLTNNPAALTDSIDFGLRARLRFGEMNANPGGLRALIQRLTANGTIDEQISDSLQQKAENADAQLASAEFTSSRNMLRALSNEVDAQRGKKIAIEAAGQLTSYVAYLVELLTPSAVTAN